MPAITRRSATRAFAHRPAPAPTFDERLALAALAVDARTDTRPLDLADVIRRPVEMPRGPQLQPYKTPLASLFHRAQTRIENGWCKKRLRDEKGAACLIGAIRAEARSRREADDACAFLLDLIQAEFDPNAKTVPSWNDNQHDPRAAIRVLGRAAERADARGI